MDDLEGQVLNLVSSGLSTDQIFKTLKSDKVDRASIRNTIWKLIHEGRLILGAKWRLLNEAR